MESPAARTAFVDPPVSPRPKLAAIWTSVLFLMIYADYFELYLPGKLQSMLDGQMGPLGPVTERVMVGVTVLMSVPSVMIALSLLLPATATRWTNIVLAAVYIAITLMVIQGAWQSYVLFRVLEIALLASAITIAWRWRRAAWRAVAASARSLSARHGSGTPLLALAREQCDRRRDEGPIHES